MKSCNNCICFDVCRVRWHIWNEVNKFVLEELEIDTSGHTFELIYQGLAYHCNYFLGKK